MLIKIFLDSDVIVSSLISSTGAAFQLLSQPDLKLIISNSSQIEIERAIKKLNLDHKDFISMLPKLEILKLTKKIEQVRAEYKAYTYDLDDAHIVAAAVIAKANFLISYNLKDYNSNKIKQDFDLIIMTPGLFLEYLRSRN
jgi:predicted nucleic acid-binding protein